MIGVYKLKFITRVRKVTSPRNNTNMETYHTEFPVTGCWKITIEWVFASRITFTTTIVVVYSITLMTRDLLTAAKLLGKMADDSFRVIP